MLENYYNVETKTFTIPYDFNKELNSLLTDVQIIIFEQDFTKKEYSQFNKSVDNLPNKITRLAFGRYFNQSVNNLPKNLTHLLFTDCFNQSVNSLPNNLTHLTFGYCFNESVNSLPSTLIEIGFWSHCSKIKNNIPNSIEFLNINFNYDDKYNKSIENISSNVKEIRINIEDKANYLKKIPFGSKIIVNLGKEIFR
jgi:hypothetical protein